MNPCLKRILSVLCVLLSPVPHFAAPYVSRPGVKSPTTFALFVDRGSYAGAKSEIEAYRAVVEREGLGTWLLVDDWASPEAVREQIVRLCGGRSPLEGAVFIGEIPIAMVRDAQHLTTAFKASQRRDWLHSSVPSDRFYDDLDLRFDFLRRDDDHPLLFYYSLSPDSPQHISSDLYTARIRPPHRAGDDPVELLRRYLRKVVAAHGEANVLDHLFVFRGHGYNSESRDAWSGEQVSLREQLPGLFRPGSRVGFYDFESRWPMKPYLFEKMGQPDVDVALCHHHGSPTMQYLNGYRNGSDLATSIGNIRLYLRSKLDGADDYAKARDYFIDRYGVPESWCAVNDSLRRADSLYNRALDIHLDELRTRAMNPRFVMLDACFNGSFHLDDCVAASYIFGPGACVVTQGNTVNALQDKWPDRYLGLLDCGVRIGQWGRHVHSLETHLIGDPTYRFVNRAFPDLDLNAALSAHRDDPGFWLRLTGDDVPADVAALALRRLDACGYEGLSDLLLDRVRTSAYGSLRLEALTLLSTKHDPRFPAALRQAVEDPYELVRRRAAWWLGECGEAPLARTVSDALADNILSSRVSFQLERALFCFDAAEAAAALKGTFGSRAYLHDGAARLDGLLRRVEQTEARLDAAFSFASDTTNRLTRRLGEITYFRNYRHHGCVPRLIALAEDPSAALEMRQAAIEALGWFFHSWQRPAIGRMCDRLLSGDLPEPLRRETLRTRNRLRAY